jgi:hypothetical protein
MLHSLPAVLDDLERRLVQGADPLPLLNSIQWADIIDWPRNGAEALRMKQRLTDLHALIQGLDAPLRAALMGLNDQGAYQARGGMAQPTTLSVRLHQHA